MSFRIGRLMGIPVTIDVSWFVVFTLMSYTLAESYFPQMHPEFSKGMNWVAGIIAALLLFCSVLLHELMHSYVARKNGLPISGITLFIFGGVSRMTEEPRTPGVEFKMAIAGPATSFALACLFWVARVFLGREMLGDLGATIVGYLAGINLTLAIFNMIPGFPLDGGRVLRALIWSGINNLERATEIASRVGQGFGYVFIFGGFWLMMRGGFLSGVWLIFIGWFLSNAAQQSFQQMTLRHALSGIPVSRIMATDFIHIDPNLPVDQFVHDYLLTHDYNAFPVTDGETLIGLATLDEVRGLDKQLWKDTKVRDIAKSPEHERTIDDTEDAFDALVHMAEGGHTRLLVLHEGKLKGVVDRDSILNLVRTKLKLGI